MDVTALGRIFCTRSMVFAGKLVNSRIHFGNVMEHIILVDLGPSTGAYDAIAEGKATCSFP